MTDTGNELSEILSETPAPAVVTGTETIVTPAPETGAQPRDEHGKVASTATPEPVAELPPETVQPPGGPQAAPPEGFVPHGRFHAANETAKQQKERADRLEAMLEQALSQPNRQQPPAQQQEQPKAKDFWEDPDAFVKQALSPLQQSGQRQFERVSRMMAVSAHGEEKVTAAFNAIKASLSSNPQATAHEYQRIMSSDHPYDELVKWHGRNETLSRIGNDPDAWLEAEMERRLTDPAYQAKVLERIQAGASQSTANRSSAPATQLPPSLHKLPGGTNSVSPGLADDSERFTRALAG